MIITLCGSTRFKKDFESVRKICLSQGMIVFSPEVFSHADNLKLALEEIESLRQLHMRKIELCNFVMVINSEEYVGEDTLKEILHAYKHNIPVFYLY